VAVAGGRRRQGEPAATAGKPETTGGRAGGDSEETRLGRAREVVVTGGRGSGDGRQAGVDGRARRWRRKGKAAATSGKRAATGGQGGVAAPGNGDNAPASLCEAWAEGSEPGIVGGGYVIWKRWGRWPEEKAGDEVVGGLWWGVGGGVLPPASNRRNL